MPVTHCGRWVILYICTYGALFYQESEAYEEWKFWYYPHIAEVLNEFPSLRVSPTFLLSQLPLLQPRFYSISSSPKMFPGEIHVTVAVVNYSTQGKIPEYSH